MIAHTLDNDTLLKKNTSPESGEVPPCGAEGYV